MVNQSINLSINRMHAVSKNEYLISFNGNGLKHIVTSINSVLSRVCECGHIEVNSLSYLYNSDHHRYTLWHSGSCMIPAYLYKSHSCCNHDNFLCIHQGLRVEKHLNEETTTAKQQQRETGNKS